MSNKMLLALFACGAVAVGTIALRNKTNEAPVVAEAVEAVVTDENCPTTETAAVEVTPVSTTEAVVTEVVEEEAPVEEAAK